MMRITLDHPFLMWTLPVIFYWLFWLDKRIFGWGVFLSAFLAGHWALLPMTPPVVPSGGQIIQIEDNAHTLKTPEGTYTLYPQDTVLAVGDIIEGDFRVLPSAPATLVGAFDGENYQRGKRLQGSLVADALTVVAHETLPTAWPVRVEAYIDREFTHMTPYLKAFFLGDSSEFNPAFMDAVRALGIAHIFAVSGLHVGLLVGALSLLLKRVHPDLKTLIIFAVLGGYLILTDFSVSLVRASLLYAFIALNHRWKGPFSALDGLSVLVLGNLLVHPDILYQTSFLLSYGVTMVLLLMAPTLKSKSAPFLVSIYAFMTTLPLIMTMSGTVNLSSLLLNIPAVLTLGMYLLPLSYLVFFFPALDSVVVPLFAGFEWLVLAAKQHVYLPLAVPYTFGGFRVIYYAGWVFVLIQSQGSWRKLLTFSSVLILGFMSVPYLQPWPVLSMLDVDGDAFLYQSAWHQCHVLIDGGTEWTSEALIKHLKNHGVKTLDVVVTTHDDADHSHGIEAILKDGSIPVRTHVIEGAVPPSITCGDVALMMDVPTRPLDSKNENSIVVLIQDGTWQGLFAGDIEAAREAMYIESHPPRAVDLLKVSHHGSKSSTSEAFLDHVRPDVALINLPHVNRFDFPAEAVIARLEDREIAIYRSDHHGTTRFIIGPTWMIPIPSKGP
jgi:competence protein ComEC